MGSIEHDLNAYLFLEFGMEGEETSISETWPFSLRRLGEIGVRVIFEFDDDDEQYFAISGPCLDFLPKNGMTIDDLALQFVGSEWIAAQDSVSLAMTAVPHGDAWHGALGSGSNHNARARRQLTKISLVP